MIEYAVLNRINEEKIVEQKCGEVHLCNRAREQALFTKTLTMGTSFYEISWTESALYMTRNCISRDEFNSRKIRKL